MSTMFDSEVHIRRNATPCAQIDFARLLRRLAWHSANQKEKQVQLTVSYRPSVSSRMWWELRYVGEDGEQRVHWSQDLDLLLWRVATSEALIEQKRKLKRKAPDQADLPSAEDLDRVAEEEEVRRKTA
jgi:hypothetical protein